MTNNDIGLAGNNTDQGTQKFLNYSRYESASDINGNSQKFIATKDYDIKNIIITQSSSPLGCVYAYSIFKASPNTPYVTNVPEIIDMNKEVDDPNTTEFDESKIWYTRLIRPNTPKNWATGLHEISIDLTGVSLNINDQLYVRVTNNLPYGQSENLAAKVEITLQPK